jgi:hypothetical protein
MEDLTMIGQLRLWTTSHRRITSLLAAALVAATFSIVSAPAAQAQSYTCPEYGAQTFELNDGSASATVYVSEDCSDGLSRYDGTVRDILCDGREARLTLEFSNPDAWINQDGQNSWPYRTEVPTASNGCGTEATFTFSTTNPNPDVQACVRAGNWGPSESSGDCAWF